VSQLQLREATLQDEELLMPMMRALAQQDPEVIPFDESAVRVAFHRFLSLPAFGRIWLLYEDATLAGYIILTIGFSFEFQGHDAFIDELYILPACRRRGYGRQAMAFVDEEARKMGVNAIHLEVDHGNAAALELYRRSGYRDHKRFLMTKWLRS